MELRLAYRHSTRCLYSTQINYNQQLTVQLLLDYFGGSSLQHVYCKRQATKKVLSLLSD